MKLPREASIPLALALAVLALATALPGCGDGGKPAAAAPEPLAVPLETIRKREMPLTYEAAGTVRSAAVAVIASKILGEVKALPVREGDRVKAGQLLVEIDSRDAATAKAIGAVADAVVIGSKIIQLIENQPRDQVASVARDFLQGIRSALD